MIKDFEPFKYSLDSKKGLAYNSFYFIIGIAILAYNFIIISNDNLAIFFLVTLILSVTAFILYLLYWIYRRLNYAYYRNKIYVIFAVTIEYDDKHLMKQYDELVKSFKEQLKDYDMGKNIIVVKKPLDIEFSDHSSAEAKTRLNSLCSTLIISGLPITTDKEVKFKFNFHYEFVVPDMNLADYFKSKFQKNVSKALIGKSWTVKNSISSKTITFNNLFNVSTYILSLCSVSLGLLDRSLKLLEPIRKEVNENITDKAYGPLIVNVRDHLYSINKIKFDIKYWQMDLDVMVKIADELYRLDKNRYETKMALAVVSELQGNRTEAKYYTEEAKFSSPKGSYDYLFNYIYFNLDEGNYPEALVNIDELANKYKTYDIRFIVRFLYKKYERTENKILLFNIGVILVLYGEKKLGCKELRKFNRLAKKANGKQYDLLIQKALGLMGN